MLLPSPHLHRPPATALRRRFPPIAAATPHRISLISSSLPNDENDAAVLRTHNAKSAAVLLRHLDNQIPPEETDIQSRNRPLDRDKLLEIALQSKRTPQFPGSIYINSSLPLAHSVFQGQKVNFNSEDEIDEEMLMKALEIRRKVTAEVFKEAMKKAKFGITYSENLVSELSDFLDYVMIKAVSMKKLPEFERCSYNVRARIFIDESEVVSLVRWLKHNMLSYRQIGKLICASKGNLRAIRQMAEWLKTIHVKGRFIGVALTRAGRNVLERSFEELDEIVEYLEENGVRSDWMGYVVSRCPEILAFTMEELRARTEF